ncbi:TPA_exp: putative FAD dependent oxidoreductase [Trichophyton benhamiae CBS 112371]|nr:TPA_exp: putative FAD dependent oxidoreductase [Trichophyton benhamiae CBS 112371]
MEERALMPVTLPWEKPTTSYWQVPPDGIADLRSTAELPPDTDIAIIGSGISGACIAYNILTRSPHTRVVILEARQACSGASGRNGGHTKAASYTSFGTHAAAVGIDEAVKIARLEYDTIKQVHAFAREHSIPCDSCELETVDIIYDQKAWDESVQAIDAMRKAMGEDDPASKYTLWNSKDAEEKFLCKGAVGAITYEAGSINAYKFVIGVLKLSLAKGANLQTGTPVTRITSSPGGSNKPNWSVLTPRGQILASKVVMATNGYAAALYPPLHGRIVPLKGQVTAQRPGVSMPKDGLAYTYSFVYAGGFDYMIPYSQDPRSLCDIVIGGGFTKGRGRGLYEYGTTDDATLAPEISGYLASCTEMFFGDNWGQDSAEGRVRQEWAGIMGYSTDGFPWVGDIPDEPGLYISASFQGHGMVMCFSCAKALTSILFNDDRSPLSTWFPRVFEVTTARLNQVRIE